MYIGGEAPESTAGDGAVTAKKETPTEHTSGPVGVSPADSPAAAPSTEKPAPQRVEPTVGDGDSADGDSADGASVAVQRALAAVCVVLLVAFAILFVLAFALSNLTNDAEITWAVIAGFFVLVAAISLPLLCRGFGGHAEAEPQPLGPMEIVVAQGIPDGCHDYVVDCEGNPTVVENEARGDFRCSGDCHMQFGFQLTVRIDETL